MKQPPRDPNGVIVPHNHEDIGDDWFVIRRIASDWLSINVKDGELPVTTLTFNESSEPPRGMSIDIEQLLLDDDIEPRKWVTSTKHPYSAVFRVGDLRQLGLMVGYDPLDNDNKFPANPYHGEVWGINSRSIKKQLRRLADWYVGPE